MSYSFAAALQSAVYGLLVGDAEVQNLAGGRVYDAVPTGDIPSLYVTLGPEEVRDRGENTGQMARHDFTVSVVADQGGFLAAKSLAAAISDVLVDARPVLSRGRVVRMDFRRASARQAGRGARRRIDLQFSALVADA
ncbi:MAG: DUF3168 domain-containing protein [Pseudomonadota bacterium]